ncbi:MAG: energy-coupling factor transporter transmembrane protein EcfT, partial [Lactobacillus iners]|nr:energy-coupling factor transporter transmembrane protein EcfT [Lactobacillus iners]
FSLILIIKAFYLPCLSAKLLIKTTDVGSLLSALSQINIPRTIRIPIAVIFRFFPSFKQEYQNMHLAMKVKNITWRTPIKCIYNPIKRTHYFSIKFGLMDILYLLSLLLLVTKGCKLC